MQHTITLFEEHILDRDTIDSSCHTILVTVSVNITEGASTIFSVHAML